MIRQIAFYFCALFLPATLSAQDTEYFLQIQVFYAGQAGQPFEFAGAYQGQFEQEPANIVLNSLTLSRTPGQIGLRLSFYSRRGLITPDEVIINGQTAANPADASYTIVDPSAWPDQKPLTISLFSNWPALDHWIDIPIVWDGRGTYVTEQRRSLGYNTTGVTSSSPTDRSAAPQTMMISPGHAIQVATSNKPPGAELLESFQDFGTVYYISEPPFYKIRVGTFETKQGALDQLRTIRRFQGGAYADAFYLYENQARTVMTTGGTTTPDLAIPPEYDFTQKAPTPEQQRTLPAPPVAYERSMAVPGRIYQEAPGISIQLSVHTTPPNLSEYSYLSDIGNMYLLRDGGIYRLSVGPFHSKEAAEEVLPQLQAAGFSEAFIRIP